MTTRRRNSRIIEEMHETAQDLFRGGVITKAHMDEFTALRNLRNVPVMSPGEIRALRQRTNLSQAVFAMALNTSVSTVQKWEAGDKKPSGPSLRLLGLIERKGLQAVL